MREFPCLFRNRQQTECEQAKLAPPCAVLRPPLCATSRADASNCAISVRVEWHVMSWDLSSHSSQPAIADEAAQNCRPARHRKSAITRMEKEMSSPNEARCPEGLAGKKSTLKNGVHSRRTTLIHLSEPERGTDKIHTSCWVIRKRWHLLLVVITKFSQHAALTTGTSARDRSQKQTDKR